jgi:hypothetical protein
MQEGPEATQYGTLFTELPHLTIEQLNYNFVIREVLLKNYPTLYEQCAVDFFFPIPVRSFVVGRYS